MTTTTQVEVQTEGKDAIVTFLKGKHELAKLLKELAKHSDAAVKYLVDTLQDKDADVKVKVDCAKTLIQLQAQVAKQISEDEMARLIAQVKLGGKGKSLTLTPGEGGEEKPTTPRLDFDSVREV